MKSVTWKDEVKLRTHYQADHHCEVRYLALWGALCEATECISKSPAQWMEEGMLIPHVPSHTGQRLPPVCVSYLTLGDLFLCQNGWADGSILLQQWSPGTEVRNVQCSWGSTVYSLSPQQRLELKLRLRRMWRATQDKSCWGLATSRVSVCTWSNLTQVQKYKKRKHTCIKFIFLKFVYHTFLW